MSDSNANLGEGKLPAGRTTRVLVGYTSAYPDALVVRRGSRLTVEPRSRLTRDGCGAGIPTASGPGFLRYCSKSPPGQRWLLPTTTRPN